MSDTTPVPSSALQARLDAVRDAISRGRLDALVITHPPNVLYLTNFASSSSIAVLTEAQVYLLADSRYTTSLSALLDSPSGTPSGVPVPVAGSYDETLATLVARELEGGAVGFESAHLSVKRHGWLTARLRELAGESAGARLEPTDGLVEGARVVKDAFELKRLRQAATALSEVARVVLGEAVRPGRSERDVAADIDHRMRMAGFERPAFDTIVASGPNSALPHGRPGGRSITEGDLVLLDFGGVHGGYCVDLTRTVAVGRPGAEARRLYRAVAAAQDAAIAAVGPGVSTEAVDAAARGTLASHGLAGAFGHATGHGLGLEVHEDPRVGPRRPGAPEPVRLQAGMVITIEPGAYVPGTGGVRLEDDVLVTPDGAERLTDVPRDDRLLNT